MRSTTIPRVVLVGGPPCVGKSAVARCIAARYEYGCISTDDIGKAVSSVYSALSRNKIDPMDGMDWREYFTKTPVDLLLDHDAESRKRMWPALDQIIRAHSTWGDPLVMEGYALWPEQVIAAGFAGTGAIWLTCDDLLLESRIRSDPDFYRGAVDEEALIDNFLRRSSRYNELMLRSAAQCSATVIHVLCGHSVEDVAGLCVSALAGTEKASYDQYSRKLSPKRGGASMLAIDMEGARKLCTLLVRVRCGETPSDAQLQDVLTSNAFFVDYYSQWEGLEKQTIADALLQFDKPGRSTDSLADRIADGFREAVDEMDVIESRMDWLARVDPTEVSERVLVFVPGGTPLDSTIHLTVDAINGAFAYQDEMGVSLLRGATDRSSFEVAVAHELHHVCFRFWAEHDGTRRKLKQERSGRAVAVLHVENLLSEGMANYYCSPRYVFETQPGSLPEDAYAARLARLRGEEDQLFSIAEDILRMSLEPEADYGSCLEAYESLALDMEDFQLPAAHYLGARMVQVMDREYPQERIVACMQDLSRFLPLYNEAAGRIAGYRFEPRLVWQFGRLFGAHDPENRMGW